MRKNSIKKIAATLAALSVMSVCSTTVSASGVNGNGKPIDTTPDIVWDVPVSKPSATTKPSSSSSSKNTVKVSANYTGWKKANGNKYYFRKGKMQKSQWLKVNGKEKYYLRSDGRVATGKIKIGKIVYVFDDNGVLKSDYGNMYDAFGKRLTKAQTIEYTDTYVLENGKLFSNTHLIVTCKKGDGDELVTSLTENKFLCIKMSNTEYYAYFPMQLKADDITKVIKKLKQSDIITSVSRDYA